MVGVGWYSHPGRGTLSGENQVLSIPSLSAGRAVCPRLSSEERATKRPCLASAVSTVALNFQTPGYEMDLNAGRFLVNGQCGYILKPIRLRSPNTTFDPECPGPPRTTLTIQVRGLGRALPGVPSAGMAPARGQRRPGEGILSTVLLLGCFFFCFFFFCAF